MTTYDRARNSLLAITTQRSDDLLLFVFAFDGVLAAYQSDPRLVRLAPNRRAQLLRLQRIPRVVVGVVSGRPLSELRRLVKLGDAAFYIGLHGLEVVGRHFERIRNEIAGDYRRRLLETSDAVGRTIRGVAGTRLEFKGAVLALHTREATSEDAIWSRFQLLGASSDLVTSGVARVVRGHDVLELVPNPGHAKAHALVAIRQILESRYHRSVFTVYIGDDVRDDDSLDAIPGHGVAAVVGGERSETRCRLATPSDVDQLIQEFIFSRENRDEETYRVGHHVSGSDLC